MRFWREGAAWLLVLLIVSRFAVGAVLPLSADEAYYWLWSQHLAAGYYDHPPGIAYVIRAGTLLFGDTSLGVRLGGLLLSVLASWFVWRSGTILLGDRKAGLTAALLFNVTLMIAVETMAATPDSPSIAMAAAFLFCLAKVEQSRDGRWWLAAGMAAGLGLLAKYSALFLGVGCLFWLIAAPAQRRWLASPFPYLGGLIAALIFAPNVWWNANHGWETFAFQFGRISSGNFTPRYLFEFVGAEFLLATPFIFILGVLALTRRREMPLAAALCWPSIAYFLVHALHDRVQGNWPCFLFPAFAILAVTAMRADWTGRRRAPAHAAGRLAIPVAGLLLATAYMQALFNIVPMGRNDPMARLLAVGMDGVTQAIATVQNSTGTSALVTTDYASTSWLRFYMPGEIVVAATENFRWNVAAPAPALLQKPLLYVVEAQRDRHQDLTAYFSDIKLVAETARSARGSTVALYRMYRVSGWRGTPLGRLP